MENKSHRRHFRNGEYRKKNRFLFWNLFLVCQYAQAQNYSVSDVSAYVLKIAYSTRSKRPTTLFTIQMSQMSATNKTFRFRTHAIYDRMSKYRISIHMIKSTSLFFFSGIPNDREKSNTLYHKIAFIIKTKVNKFWVFLHYDSSDGLAFYFLSFSILTVVQSAMRNK